MEVAKKKAEEGSTTTAQQLGSLIKSCRDIMRKDKGLNGDLDRLPMLTWVLFLKFLDDLEQMRETEAKLEGKRFRSAIESPYRWRDWAAQPDGITGDALIAFINQDEATRPDGTRGPGLFATLRSLTGGHGTDRRDVIRAVFNGTANRMLNGYLLRDMVNKVHGIQFTSSEEMSTLGHLYESMLREMRDAAGDSGEFYTPRALVKFMVAVADPRLGETVLDPACGTGGFLTESFEHLKKQCRTTEDHHRLQLETLSGVEAKPLPYLLCQMNLLLHGLESPQIDPLNALRHKLGEIGDRDRVDVILTNPPFGGEEQRGILGNFPADKQTAETALLFLQLIMRKLRRQPKPGRAAVVVPNGTLFGDGICARIKEELLRDFNLHTIVRLPNGVFAPYTGIPTNVLFFDRSGPTQDVWYYEQPLPEGRKSYTKTQPLQFDEFADCIAWWKKREESDRAWKVPAAELLASGCNLDRKNPRAKEDFEHLPPEQLADDILKKEQRIAAIVAEIKTVLAHKA
jgi:type I restriction enzyme M protein